MDTALTAYALEDPFFYAKIKQIIADYKIEAVVETGLDRGLSAVEFCRMVPQYVGIDINPLCVTTTELVLEEAGIAPESYVLIAADSRAALKGLALPPKTLYFLDAHCFGDTDCPIIDEIDALPRGSGVLALHDIWVPGREHGGFSPLISGEPTPFDYELIEPALTRWSATHRVEYLQEYAKELAPGVMFVFP